MAIEFSNMLNGINNTIYSLPFFNSIFSSIIYTSIILSILIIIIIVFIYPCKEDTPVWILAKLFVYLFTINTLVFSLNHASISNNFREKSNDMISDEFITNINKRGGNAYEKDSIQVIPKFANKDIYEPIIDIDEPITMVEPTVESLLNDIKKRL